MASRTFNRRPLTVDTPSKNDINDYYFNHCNWKGVNIDKNFLTVDQETFADAKNVYANSEGLLRSRPSLKRKNMLRTAQDFWVFDDIEVYKNGDELEFVKDGESYEEIVNSDNVNLVKIQDKIYCFTEKDFFYFDIKSCEFHEGHERVYVPNTVFDANGAKTKVESKNLFTDREIYTYLYDINYGISTDAYGKDLTVEIENKEYNVNFNEKTKDLLADVKFTIPEGYDTVLVSNRNTYAFYSASSRIIAYSVTGKAISRNIVIPNDIGDIIGSPKFTQDGSHIVLADKNGIYIISVVDDTGAGELFTTWTEITNDGPWELNTVDVKFDFISYDNFTYALDASGFIRIVNYNGDYVTTTVIAESCKSLIYTNKFNRYEDGAIFISVGDNDDAESVYTIYSPDLSEWHSIDATDYSEIIDCKILNDKIYLVTFENSQTCFYTIYDDFTISNKGVIYGARCDAKISSDGSKILFSTGKIYYINSSALINLIVKPDEFSAYMIDVIAYTDHTYYIIDDKVYSSLLSSTLEFNYSVDGENHILPIQKISKLNDFYLSSDTTLFINAYREVDGEFYWYLPESNKQTFDNKITGLHPISSTEMSVFFNDEIWYVSSVDGKYYCTKSKLQLGLKDGGDIITSYDGSQIIFATERGLVALSYQDFVASTDQVFTFLSDTIYELIKSYCKDPIKLFKFDFWIFLYKDNSNDVFVFDVRNNSWWPWSYEHHLTKLMKYNDEVLAISNGNFYRFDYSNDNYYDYDGNKHHIDWYVVSQKLHLSAINYYKRLSNITLSSVIDIPNTDEPVTYDLDILNYRKTLDDGQTQTIGYKVQVLRTYVQRLNYPKVNEFQYTLRTDHDNTVQLPLSLSNITLKYKITGQVR